MQQSVIFQPKPKLATPALLLIGFTLLSAPSFSIADVVTMDKAKYAARIDNIYFLARIGVTLRRATEDIAREDLPANIKHLLARLDRLEARERAKQRKSDTHTP